MTDRDDKEAFLMGLIDPRPSVWRKQCVEETYTVSSRAHSERSEHRLESRSSSLPLVAITGGYTDIPLALFVAAADVHAKEFKEG